MIEAHHLFGLSYERIEVVVHPRCLVHAFVRMRDGPCSPTWERPMRVPIAYALHYPSRISVAAERLTWPAGYRWDSRLPTRTHFQPFDWLDRRERGDAATCALNAANEVAVRAFLNGNIPFLGISR